MALPQNHFFLDPVIPLFLWSLNTFFLLIIIPGLGRVRWMRTELCLVTATDSSQGRGCWEVQEGVSEEMTGAPHPKGEQR